MRSLLLQHTPQRLTNLAYVLIDNDRNIEEGLDFADEVLASNPDNYDGQHVKGWDLYKQGKYQEALETLQKSWELRRQHAIYDHDLYLHLEEVKQALANQPE